MNIKQLTHYMKGGVFLAKYLPKDTSTLRIENYKYIGKSIKVHFNMQPTPILTGRYVGDFRFDVHPDSVAIKGWIPESDLYDLQSIGETVTDFYNYLKPHYLYKLTYDDHVSIFANFGKGLEDVSLPFVINRGYTQECDEYILKLSKPQATVIEKAFWKGDKLLPEIQWETIFQQSKPDSK